MTKFDRLVLFAKWCKLLYSEFKEHIDDFRDESDEKSDGKK